MTPSAAYWKGIATRREELLVEVAVMVALGEDPSFKLRDYLPEPEGPDLDDAKLEMKRDRELAK